MGKWESLLVYLPVLSVSCFSLSTRGSLLFGFFFSSFFSRFPKRASLPEMTVNVLVHHTYVYSYSSVTLYNQDIILKPILLSTQRRLAVGKVAKRVFQHGG